MSEDGRLAAAERLLYAWMLKDNADEDAFNLDLYEETWAFLGLPGRMDEHKAAFESRLSHSAGGSNGTV